MKISYDPEVDALSITFRETTVTTKHLAEGIAATTTAKGGSPAWKSSMRKSVSAELTPCAASSSKASAHELHQLTALNSQLLPAIARK